tara:strand:+ start:151 stop:444 length:294 start_codon:yes stop_codon:yes gene_type:complete
MPNNNPEGKGGFEKGLSGNPNGRPKNPTIVQFREAIEKIEKEKDCGLIEHAIREAYKDNKLLAQILKKLIPDIADIDTKEDYRIVLINRYALNNDNN